MCVALWCAKSYLWLTKQIVGHACAEYVQNIKVKMTGEVKYHDFAFVGGVRLWLCSKFTFQLIFESIKMMFFCVCVRRIYVRGASLRILPRNFILFCINIHLSYKNNNICYMNYASSSSFAYVRMKKDFTLHV